MALSGLDVRHYFSARTERIPVGQGNRQGDKAITRQSLQRGSGEKR